MSNRLADANSVYLLQHADNPVDWWQWGDEPFIEARHRDVPVFLSVGYSSCHWCHVMAHESFEDEATAAQLNANFVAIKLDREVRPDVDDVYMRATQALTGQGGWPMSVWLDHDRRPFHAGTYFPPRPVHGRPSFRQVLTAVTRAWEDRRDEVAQAAASLTDTLVAHNDRDHTGSDGGGAGSMAGPGSPPPDAVGSGSAMVEPVDAEEYQTDLAALAHQAVELVVKRVWDREFGGFGRAPKFPQAMLIGFLLDHHVVTGHDEALAAAVSSLDAMARGGIHDHVVGGFARYSTDARWLLPHFEKMLYDNGLLLEDYAIAAAITGRDDFARVAAGIVAWFDEMQADEGGFHAALDADTDGEEGATTVWNDEEFRAVVADAGVDPDLAAAWFNVRPEGNFRPERGQPTGDNILHTPQSPAGFADEHGLDVDTWQAQVDRATKALAQVRAQRSQPELDDKVITAWNALAIRGLARAAGLLGRGDWAAMALRAVEFVRDEMVDEDGMLLHVHRAGHSWVPALLDDQAGLALALVELAPVVGRPDLLAWAVELVDDALEVFAAGKGFAMTRAGTDDLLLRPRDQWDNAQPAGTSLLAAACARLGLLTGRHDLTAVAHRIVAAPAQQVAANPIGFGELLRAVQFMATEGREVAIVGPASDDRDALVATVLGTPRPGTVTAVADDASDPSVALLAGRNPADDGPRAWVCRNFTCRLPVTTAVELAEQLA